MKCLCGYYHMEDWELDRDSGWGVDKEKANDLKMHNGRESFIKIEGGFHVEGSHGYRQEIHLYMCPECGTIRAQE